ncbi:methylmalonyl-CoA mutase family protein [Paractinoplanes brasiliensis]|uniref:Heterodimeric methylmalonyl-CoA mutase small subunit n=1 Tax=Paractinoplanes brasiliensis TaxID=52695 RepID=A0A4R6J9V7_9ACTN|nr:methylmalonyl-CoA mutase family protein [Actinoplanes brasiliensis]TDO32430.1 heterodimeric methylmalonyl-CoA mutase small subunit [Actinoplanes brasiliensis]GID27697.1 methylmalonyl-CoA mutase [Actinoplanes brasiliensis]
MAGNLTLGADFPAATAGQWRRLALAALRKSGAATDETTPEQVEELLATATYGGPSIAALHTTGPDSGVPGVPPFVRGTRAAAGAWDIRQRYADAAPKEAREAVLTDLENGATSLWLVLGDGTLPPDSLPEALDGVHLDLAAVVLDAGGDTGRAARAWFELLAARGADPSRVTGNLGADPLGLGARTGEAADLREAAELAVRCAAETPGVRAVTVDATVYHDAGGSEVEELAAATATGVAYLRALTGAGMSVPAALGQLEFRYAATADQFATIAKLRAARRIWARVAELSGAARAGGQRQHAVTSAAMMTARDPWVNLLRTTIAAFAAGVGGAQAVTVLPFDHQLGRPELMARRLARNTQTLLVEESHVARVADPAGGSWYVEKYTEQLAVAAWEWFTRIEKEGGAAAALGSGLIADRLAEVWAARESNLAHRRDPITGVSEFPDLAERRLERRPAAEPPGGGLPRRRYAEAYERLRDRADAHLAATGERPTVRLALFGPAAAHGARLTFTTNLFAAGGIAVTTEGSSPVVVLCGPDKEYAEHAEAEAARLREAGATRIVLAGKGEYAGVDTYVHVGADAVAVLTTTLDDLGVAR